MPSQDRMAGHWWTIAPSVRHRLRPAPAPPASPWSTPLIDSRWGTVTLSGALSETAGSDSLLLIVHGLGGSPDAHYCRRAASAAEQLGWSSLRLALRGADRRGEDFYHGGLAEDLEAALACPRLAAYSRVYVLGYSMGGHVSLRLALRPRAALAGRLKAVAAVCAPLDLELGCQNIDSPALWFYRGHVLRGLKEIYAEVAARRPVPTPMLRIAKVRAIREWDALTVVPRYGFSDVADYYGQMSVGPRLRHLEYPTLVVASRHDPMVPPWTYEQHLTQARACSALRVAWVERGGHVGFPGEVTLGLGGQGSLEQQVLHWLAAQ